MNRIQEYKYGLFDLKGIHFVLAPWFGPGIDCYNPTYRSNICTLYLFTRKVFRFSSIFIIYIQVKNMIYFPNEHTNGFNGF